MSLKGTAAFGDAKCTGPLNPNPQPPQPNPAPTPRQVPFMSKKGTAAFWRGRYGLFDHTEKQYDGGEYDCESSAPAGFLFWCSLRVSALSRSLA